MKDKIQLGAFLTLMFIGVTIAIAAGTYKSGSQFAYATVDSLTDTTGGIESTRGSFTRALVFGQDLYNYTTATGKVIIQKPRIRGVGDVSGADTVGMYLYTEFGAGESLWRRKIDSSLANVSLPCTLSFAFTAADTIFYNRLSLDLTTACSANAAAVHGDSIDYRIDYWLIERE